jgi:hypothetical protein
LKSKSCNNPPMQQQQVYKKAFMSLLLHLHLPH